MKKLIILLLLMPILLFSQDESPQLIFQLVTLTPNAGAGSGLAMKMKHHNDTYHGDGPYGARVYSVNSGTETGNLIWAMGPFTWSELENRPEDQAHDDDWDNNVQTLLESQARVDYWRLDTDLSHFPVDFTLKNLMIRYVDLKPYNEYRYAEIVKKAKEVYQEKIPEGTFGIYWNQLGNSSDGRDLMIVWFFDGLSWMGENLQFGKLYDEVHGPNSWNNAMRELEGSVEGGDSFLVTYMAGMGGQSATVVSAQRQ